MPASLVPESTNPSPRSKPDAQTAQSEFSWRVLRLLNTFRFFIALVLLTVFTLIQGPRIVGESLPGVAAIALASLLAFAAIEQLSLQKRWPPLQVQTYAQFGLDLVALVLLLHASGGIVSGLGGLLVVSIGTLALLVPGERAFLLAAVATFVLLGEQSLSMLRGLTTSADFAATGVLGAVIFVITGVVQLLRNRIVETEALAAQRGVDLQNQVELNEYIIQHLRESIVVVDAGNRVRMLNESAAALLGVRDNVRGRTLAELAPTLAYRLQRWREGSEQPMESTFVLEDDRESTKLQPHFARLGSGRQDGIVIFLEDTSLILERVQQTKLAALGRLSASIAHEIRNPLGALSHAGQLLAESDSMGPDDHRLTDIIRVNSQRVSRIVDSVLSLSRNDKTRPEKIELNTWARDFAAEFVKTQELYEGAISQRGNPGSLEAEMDRTHLHQVAWNLCDNAVKYASEAAGAIAVEISCGTMDTSGRPYLDVIDSGPGIKPEMVEQIFEPFYTAQPGGTGLGLYISRELCERNGASLRYYARHGGGSVFRIIFADPNRW